MLPIFQVAEYDIEDSSGVNAHRGSNKKYLIPDSMNITFIPILYQNTYNSIKSSKDKGVVKASSAF